MGNIYSSPEKFGLAIVGEIDWSSGSYEFDLTVVWRKPDGTLLMGEDSGCSCPGIFENDPGVDELTVVTPAELQALLEERNKNAYYDRAAEVADLMAKVVA